MHFLSGELNLEKEAMHKQKIKQGTHLNRSWTIHTVRKEIQDDGVITAAYGQKSSLNRGSEVGRMRGREGANYVSGDNCQR